MVEGPVEDCWRLHVRSVENKFPALKGSCVVSSDVTGKRGLEVAFINYTSKNGLRLLLYYTARSELGVHLWRLSKRV